MVSGPRSAEKTAGAALRKASASASGRCRTTCCGSCEPTVARSWCVSCACERIVKWRPTAPPEDIERAKAMFDPNALTLGFARRFATYKRPNLLLHDPERLARILTNQQRPVQLVLAGKAHPADQAGKDMIREWIHFVRRHDIRQHAVFLVDYDMLLAERMVAGRRCLDQHSTPSMGGQRYQWDEGAAERRPEPLGTRRMVGRSLPARCGLGAGRRQGTW